MFFIENEIYEFFDPKNIDKHFNKIYEFETINLDDDLEDLFDNENWIIEDLELLKENLNRIKNELNEFKTNVWQTHTFNFDSLFIYQSNLKKKNYKKCFTKTYENTNVYQEKPELINKGWLKLYEILKKINFNEKLIENELNCLFLCEAPGSFICALNHYLKTNTNKKIKLSWIANSLNPNNEENDPFFEAIVDDYFINETYLNWYFGIDNIGNIQHKDFIKGLNLKIKEKNLNKLDFITADGGIRNFENAEYQELNSFKLILNEIIVAINLLKNGGNFILKIFNFFECRTICAIYILACLFDNLKLYKPISSKDGNNESYLICSNFKFNKNFKLINLINQRFYESKNSETLKHSNKCEHLGKSENLIENSLINELDILLLKKNVLNQKFINNIIECSILITNFQTKCIERNIFFFKTKKSKLLKRYRIFQKLCSQQFMNFVDINLIKLDDQIVNKNLIRNNNPNCFKYFNKDNFEFKGSYLEKLNEINETDKIKVLKFEKLFNNFYLYPIETILLNFDKIHYFNNQSKDLIYSLDEFNFKDKSLIKNINFNSKFCFYHVIKVNYELNDILNKNNLCYEDFIKFDFSETKNFKNTETNESFISKLNYDETNEKNLKIANVMNVNLKETTKNISNCKDEFNVLKENLIFKDQMNNFFNLFDDNKISFSNLTQQNTELSSLLDYYVADINKKNNSKNSINLYLIEFFKKTDNEFSFFNNLIYNTDSFSKLKSNDILVLFTPPILTRYSIGLIYLFTFIFKKIKIFPCLVNWNKTVKKINFGLVIILTNDKIINEFQEELNWFLKILNKIKKTNQKLQVVEFVKTYKLLTDYQDLIDLIYFGNLVCLVEKIKKNIQLLKKSSLV